MERNDRSPPTQAEYDGWRKKFSSGGRFGTSDELGTLNHITPEFRRSAAGLVREGRSVSFSRAIDTHASPRNPHPAHHMMPVGQSGGLAD